MTPPPVDLLRSLHRWIVVASDVIDIRVRSLVNFKTHRLVLFEGFGNFTSRIVEITEDTGIGWTGLNTGR